ncbi:MAG: translation elongation factor 4 [Patescibacteria group bacterium]
MKNIRNFVIISHIDHGKSTLADRFLEITNTVPKTKMHSRFLDTMDLEQEKGITIKMQPVRMNYSHGGKDYIFNLIDTPGHIDFNYEVSRSLVAVEGALLLVDITKGIQAQTIHNLDLAKKQNLKIIAAVNKIDLAQGDIEGSKKELAQLLEISEDEIFMISGKNGTNVDKILEAVIDVPLPTGDINKPLKALIFDSKFDAFKGILAFIRVFDGEIKRGDAFYLMAAESGGEAKEVGIFSPDLRPIDSLKAGEIGYLATGIKEPDLVRVGDTIVNPREKLSVQALPGYKEPMPVVFASFYPENSDDFDLLKKALSQLKLNDAALIFEPETKSVLGRGFRCGFLGSLHIEITSERLFREFGLELIISRPQVSYQIIDNKNQEKIIYSVSDWPEDSQIKEAKEPWVKVEIITPSEFLGSILDLLKQSRGMHIETKYMLSKMLLIYEVPLREIIIDFYDNLKGISQGFASMNYELLDYKHSDLVKLEILIGGEPEETFSRVVPVNKAQEEGSSMVKKLKEILPHQQFSVPLQAVVGGKVLARETIKARRKDVTAPLYGGDVTRKRKLLERQKKGKKEMKEKSRIHIPPKIFLEMFRS